MPGMGPGLTAEAVIRAAADSDAFISTDVGQHQMWVAQYYPFMFPRQLLTSGGLGTMGFGFPAAIGAALQNPDRNIICFSGDGSLLMNIQEMAVAVEEKLNVKLILFNNQSLGLVGQQQDMFFGGRRFACDFIQGPDFVKIAEGFGMPTVDLTHSTNQLGTLKKALAEPGPGLIHVPMDAAAKVLPMVPPGAANRDMIVHHKTEKI